MLPFSNLPHVQIWRVGSHLYGLNTPESDEDFGAVFFDPQSMVDPFYNDNTTYTESNNDYWAHDLSKYARLLAKGNPTLIDLVFAEPVKKDPIISEFLTAVKPYVLHRGLASAYMGYVTNQKHRGFLYRTRENKERLARVEQLGYDPKFVSHLFRLMYQARTLMTERRHMYISEHAHIRSFLIDVKEGKFSLNVIEKLVNLHMELLEHAAEKSTLPTNDKYKRVAREFFISRFSPME